MRKQWISTAQANQILNIGICDDTFRQKFKGCVRWIMTPGKQYRWNREDVETIVVLASDPDSL